MAGSPLPVETHASTRCRRDESLGDRDRFSGVGSSIYVGAAGNSEKLNAGQMITRRATVPINAGNSTGSGYGRSFVRTTLRFNYVGDTRAWDAKDPRYQTVLDLKL